MVVEIFFIFLNDFCIIFVKESEFTVSTLSNNNVFFFFDRY